MLKIRTLILLLLLSLQKTVFGATSAEKLCILEKKMDVLEPVGLKIHPSSNSLEDRIKALETRMEYLETLCVARSGMKRHCLPPTVLNGNANCPEELPPDTTCTVTCNTGYIATPGKDTTTCKKDGFWDRDLECEIPLVVVSGGIVGNSNTGDDSVEVVSMYPSQGCNITIPNMPQADGSHRTLHNLIYIPHQKMLACNGMTSASKVGSGYYSEEYPRASCDEWSFNSKKWKRHSYPNEGMTKDDLSCSSWMNTECRSPDQKKGRYAAEIINLSGRVHVVGGMVYDKKGHEPTKTSRRLFETDMKYTRHYWQQNNDMKEKRAFFCLVGTDRGVFAIGGLSKNKSGNVVLNSVELYGKKNSQTFSSMKTSRSGHSCTVLPVGNSSILVSGGTEGFGQAAVTSAELFSLEQNTWTPVQNMNVARFGHAIVAVGSRIFALGGDDRNNNNYDTIEEFDVKEKSWKLIPQKLKKPRSNFGYTFVPHSLFNGCRIEKPLIE